jgi:hypothetical protein
MVSGAISTSYCRQIQDELLDEVSSGTARTKSLGGDASWRS